MSNHDHFQELKQREKTASSWKVGWRLASFLWPYKWTVLTAWIVQGIGLVLIFVPVKVLGDVANHFKAGDFTMVQMWKYAGIIVGVELFRFGISFPRALLHVRSTGRAEWDLQVKLYDAIQRMGLSYHDRESSGQLISRMIMDIRSAGSFFRMVIFNMVETLLVLVIGTGFLLLMNWQLALWSLAVLPLTILLILRFASRIRRRFYDVRQQHGDLTTVISENIAGVQVVRGFAREQEEMNKFRFQAMKLIDTLIRAFRMWAFYTPLFGSFVTVGLALTFWMGGDMVMNNPQDEKLIGLVFMFFLAMRQITPRLRQLGRGISHAQRAIASADRLFELLDETPDVADKPGAGPLKEGPGHVVFDGVSFAYGDGTHVLSNIDLTVEPGQMVALVGRTGSGKSTMASLLPRFYDVTEGRILIDGQDIRDVTTESLRSDIGLVFQDSFLFSRTVAENIAYSNPDTDLDRITQTATAARAHDFVKELPDGYDTIIGERGVTLSGGQRQRLTIARALLKDPRILILDDSTSSVDPTTEREIHEAMMHLAKYRTTFVIAHRLSTVRRADVIVVLDDGKIVERGTHEELVAERGVYRAICDLQFEDAFENGDADEEAGS